MPPKASKGAKAKKGLSAKKNRRGAGNARNNPKAFAASSGPYAGLSVDAFIKEIPAPSSWATWRSAWT